MSFSTRHPESADAPRPSAVGVSAPPAGCPEVVLADPDASRGRALVAALQGEGVRAAPASALDAAALRDSGSRVVVLRRRLGSVDGLALVREIARVPGAPRVLILGEEPSGEEALRAVDAGAAGILFEPHRVERLASRIRRLLAAPAEPSSPTDTDPLRIRSASGVVYKLRTRPEVLVDYLLQATDDLACAVPVPPPPTVSESEAELRTLRGQVRLSNEILDRVPAIVLVTDPQGRVAYAGPGVRAILGYESEQALGEGFWNQAWPDFAAAERMRSALMVSDFMRDGAPIPFDARLRSTSGATRDISFQFAAGPGGTRIVVGQDVTSRKQADAESARERRAARASAASRSDFLVKLGEEIGAPANALVGASAVLLETELSAKQRASAEAIRTSGESLLALMADALDFSRIESGALTMERQRCSVEDLIDQCLDLMAVKAAQKGLDLAGHVEETAAIEFLGDGARIRRVLVNLLSNAIRFTTTGGVLIDARLLRQERGEDGAVTRGDLVITVTDTGPGIPGDRTEHLFRPFPRIEETGAAPDRGTGLGLAISSQLASLMGGALSVESVVGEGSRFTLSLPVEMAGRAAGPHHQASGSWLAGRRILLTTAGPMTTDVITRLIARWGGTLVRSNPLEAAARLKHGETFAAALLDHRGPSDSSSASAADAGLRILKEACAASGVPVISLRPVVEARPAVVTQGLSLVSTTTPVKTTSLHRALDRAVFGRLNDAGPAKSLPPLSPSRPVVSVLVAEHNVVDQKIARLSLLSLGFSRVDVVKTGSEAEAALSALPYDVVLLDLQLPGMEDFETVRWVRSRDGVDRPWLVGLTTDSPSEERECAMAAGIDDFAVKPLRRDDLALVMERAKRALAG